MSPRRCCVSDCKSVSNQPQYYGVKYHTFPVNPTIRKIWMENCRIASNRAITKSVLVCSRHFRDTDFQPPKKGKRLLQNEAVPTIFPWNNLPSNEVQISSDPSTLKISVPDAVAEDPMTLLNPKQQTKKVNARSKATPTVDNLKQRSASAEEQSTSDVNSSPNKTNARKSLDSAAATVFEKISSKEVIVKSPLKRFDTATPFVSGAKVEVQDLNGSWHNASVVEVDQTEQEVLINFEKSIKSKGPAELNDEWIPMDSSRLRPITKVQFVEGERCLARWTDSRKFLATVQKVLDNNMFEVLFDDGFPKTVKGIHMSKLRRPADKTPLSHAKVIQPPISTKKPNKAHPIPKFDLSLFNLPEIPGDGEWCCPWVNDTPIGREGYLVNADGNKRPTVLVDDWRLPSSWTKHLYQRSSISGKWDVVLVGPNNKRFRSKNDVKVYLEENGLTYNPDIYDFSIHKRRAKDMGVYVFTDNYVPPVIPKPVSELKSNLGLGSAVQQEPFTGFAPIESTSTVLPDKELKNEVIAPTKDAAATPLDEDHIYVGALRVQIIDNLFRCPKEGCNKNFRKENHLQIHVKHYHEELSKQLGACPNMTELAYFRTMGTPIDESLPKNQIPNSQFFEKVYQTELRSNRKVESPTLAKIEIKTEDVPNPQISQEENTTLKRKSNLPEGETKEKRKPSATFQVQTPEVSLALPMIEAESVVPSIHATPLISNTSVTKLNPPLSIDAKETANKAQVHRFKIRKVSKTKSRNKIGRKRGGKNLKKRLRKEKVLNRPSLKTFVPRTPTLNENMQSEGNHQLSEGNNFASAHTSDHSLARLNRLKFLQYPAADSNHENTNSSSLEQRNNTRYISENGEMIKIVRMRQEEIINCLCSFGEEDGLMIQCELCLCWQHGGCNGIEKESDVPEKYVCYICGNPEHGRNSMKYIHDQDWLYEGKLFHANYHQPSRYSARRFDILKQSHTLTGNLLDLKRSLHSLNVKINIAANKDHPKMYLWSKKWEQNSPNSDDSTAETKLIKMESTVKPDERLAENKNESEHVDKVQIDTPEKQKSDQENCSNEGTSEEMNISSTMVQKDVEKDGSTLGHLLSSSDVNENTNKNVTERKTEHIFTSRQLPKQNLPKHSTVAKVPMAPNIPKPEAAIDSVECQHRLLEHIQKEQNLILSRLQTIDSQIIALESMDEHPDANSKADIGKTRQTIHMLLSDLMKLQKLALANQSPPPENLVRPQQYIK